MGKYDELKEELYTQMETECKKHSVAGVSLALCDGDEVAMTCSYGYMDIEAQMPADPDMICGIASITKLFTATAAMRLAEEGKLDINKPVRDYIEEFSVKSRFEGSRQITIKDLMTHHSGLPRDYLSHFYSYDPRPFEVVIDYLKNEYVSNPPGYFYSYSNLAVSVLGVAVQRIAGIPYEEYIEKTILKPLGMNKSSFTRRYELSQNYAQYYAGIIPRPEIPIRNKPGGGLFSSVNDLSKFLLAYINYGTFSGVKILEKDTVLQMLTPQAENVPLSFGNKVGLIWNIGRYALDYIGKVASHGGALLYSRGDVCIIPEHRLAVAVLSNSSAGGAVIGAFTNFVLKKALEIKNIKAVQMPAKSFVLNPPLTECEPTGHYASPALCYARIYGKNGCYKCVIAKKNYDMLLNENGFFTLKRESKRGRSPFNGLKIRFCYEPLRGCKIMLINNYPDGEEFKPEKIPQEWLERIGTYKVINRMPEERFVDICHTIKIHANGKILYVDFIGNGYSDCHVVKVINGFELLTLGFGQSDNQTIHVTDTNMLSYMGMIFRMTSLE